MLLSCLYLLAASRSWAILLIKVFYWKSVSDGSNEEALDLTVNENDSMIVGEEGKEDVAFRKGISEETFSTEM